MKRQYFFSASLHINYRYNAGFWIEREKLGEWRDPDNEVFTIFTVEKMEYCERPHHCCVSHLGI